MDSEHCGGPGLAPVTTKASVALSSLFRTTTTEPTGAAARDAVVVFHGMRVRMGLYSGVNSAAEINYNKASARYTYSGKPLWCAKTVGDAGHGGQIVLSHSAFELLEPDWGSSHKHTPMVWFLGSLKVKEDKEPMTLYQAVPKLLLARLAIFPAPRCAEVVVPGVLDAPIGFLAVTVLRMVGTDVLMEWDLKEAANALRELMATCTEVAAQLGGFMSLLEPGAVMALFTCPLDATEWAIRTQDALKEADWSPKLLAHELFEEVVHVPSSRQGSGTGDGAAGEGAVIMRGPRVRMGIDIGNIKVEISAATGQAAFRGRAVVRACKAAAQAQSNQLLVSSAARDASLHALGPGPYCYSYSAMALGQQARGSGSDRSPMYSCRRVTRREASTAAAPIAPLAPQACSNPGMLASPSIRVQPANAAATARPGYAVATARVAPPHNRAGGLAHTRGGVSPSAVSNSALAHGSSGTNSGGGTPIAETSSSPFEEAVASAAAASADVSGADAWPLPTRVPFPSLPDSSLTVAERQPSRSKLLGFLMASRSNSVSALGQLNGVAPNGILPS